MVFLPSMGKIPLFALYKKKFFVFDLKSENIKTKNSENFCVFGINYVNICRWLIWLKRISLLKQKCQIWHFQNESNIKVKWVLKMHTEDNSRSVLKYKVVVDYCTIFVAHFGNPECVSDIKKFQGENYSFRTDDKG